MRVLNQAGSQREHSAAARVMGMILAAALVAGCAGENLFPSFVVEVGVDLLGPQVDITAPLANVTIAPGDSVAVRATLVSQEGIVEVSFTGVLNAGGAAAFTPVVVPLTAVTDTTMSRFLKRSGATGGAARSIVTARDIGGDLGADTVSVNLGT
jgi:hypothetical protein